MCMNCYGGRVEGLLEGAMGARQVFSRLGGPGRVGMFKGVQGGDGLNRLNGLQAQSLLLSIGHYLITSV